MPELWTLNVTTFRGTAFGAMHSYAVLQAPDVLVDGWVVSGQRYQILKVLNTESARSLNAQNERFGRDYAIDWKPGQPCQQFESDEQAEQAGVAVFQAVAPEDAVLIQSSGFGAYGPNKPLAGSNEIVTELRRIWEYDESETSNDWTDIRQDASKQWDAALDGFGLSRDLDGRCGFGSDTPKQPDPIDAWVFFLPNGENRVRLRERH